MKPGTLEWTKLNTQEMKLKACQIPSEILSKIPTKDLIDLILNYPLIINITVFSTFQAGIDDLVSNFNGLNELYSRQESAKLLMERFIKISPKEIDTISFRLEGFKYALDLIVLELLLSQKEILDQFKNEEIKLLLLNSAQKYKDKKELIGLYDEMALSTVTFLITSLILKNDPNGLLFSLNESNEMFAKSNMNSPGFSNYLPEIDRISDDIQRLIK